MPDGDGIEVLEMQLCLEWCVGGVFLRERARVAGQIEGAGGGKLCRELEGKILRKENCWTERLMPE